MDHVRPIRVLVVDDEQDVREYLRRALLDAGFTVETAVDGLDALDKVRADPPDAISLDLVMPRHSGARCYRELQKDPRLSKIPVLVVTGHARDELGGPDFEEMTLRGPGVYIEKPVSPASYVAAIRALLHLEAPPAQETPPPDDLRRALEAALSGADRDALQRALEALKKA
ncbi:MAG: response regulator [Zetaproteobacteria bacterium]|nr:MAG: response regulator [Zetaproteobacteria bacterium]